MNRGWRLNGIVLFVLLAYWAVSLEYLDVFPPVGQDEPWIAAAPYKLATQGIYGSDLFAGYYGVDRHNYQHMPLYPLLLAGVFKIAGVGVLQMRLLPVVCGLLLLSLVYALGRQIGSGRVGLLAMVLLLGLRLTGDMNATGIPLLDIARINRYDIGVPLFGLMALWAYIRAERPGSRWWYVVSGALAGMSSLSHLYGAFWLPAFVFVLFVRHHRRLYRRYEPYLLGAGFGLVWLPWMAYVGTGWPDYLGQMRFVAERLDLFNWHFYIDNLFQEVDRYRSIDLFDSTGRVRLMRPGAWSTLFGLPLALSMMWWRGRYAASDRCFVLASVFIVQALLFAVLLKVKHYNYMIALWPLAVLVLAWLGIRLWDRRQSFLLRGGLLALLALILIEGVLGIAHRRAVAAQTSAYDHFSARVANYIPPGSRVLGLQHYWLGLRQYPYRTWLLPVLLADPKYYHEPFTLEEALGRVSPDVILLDRYMGDYFDSLSERAHPRHTDHIEFWRFMDHHQARLAGVVEDPTYGTMHIYHLFPLGCSPGGTCQTRHAQ